MTDGAGMGLYLSKTIVGKMGGAIWVESEPGARFPIFVYIQCINKGTKRGNRKTSIFHWQDNIAG